MIIYFFKKKMNIFTKKIDQLFSICFSFFVIFRLVFFENFLIFFDFVKIN